MEQCLNHLCVGGLLRYACLPADYSIDDVILQISNATKLLGGFVRKGYSGDRQAPWF